MNLGLLASAARIHAQEPDGQATDGTISGTVYLPGNNQPASQVAVSLKSHEAGIFRSILTDYEGHFEIGGLPAGKYEITVEEQGYETLHATVQLDTTALKLELHLVSPLPQLVPQNANTVSVRELMIPGKAQEEYRKGLLSLAKKRLAESLKHFTSAVRAFPGYFEAIYHQGVVETSLGHKEQAMQAFQTAITLSGGRYARAQFGVGYIYYLQGNTSEAEAITRRGLEVDPDSSDGYVILALTLLRENRNDEAEKSAREALLRNPNEADAYLVLADTCARRQNYEEQIQDLDTYLKLRPDGPASQRVHEIREVALRIVNRARPQNETH